MQIDATGKIGFKTRVANIKALRICALPKLNNKCKQNSFWRDLLGYFENIHLKPKLRLF